jgi:ATP-dependent 26S proteasome regulatory subunit
MAKFVVTDLPSLPDVPAVTTRDQGADVRRRLSSHDAAKWAADWVDSVGAEVPALYDALAASALGAVLPRWLQRDAPEPAWLTTFLRRGGDMAAAWLGEVSLSDDPAWLSRLLLAEEAKVARTFLLSGNISDYCFDVVHGYRPASSSLLDALRRTKDCVLTFRLSEGLVLRTQSAEEQLPKPIRDQLEWDGAANVQERLSALFASVTRWLSGRGGEQAVDRFPRGVAIVFENIHLLIPPSSDNVERNFLVDNLLLWSNSPALFQSSHCLILTADALEDVSNELRARGGKIEQVTIPRPESSAARLKLIIPLLENQSPMPETRVAQLVAGGDWLAGYGSGRQIDRLRQLAHDTAGLTLIGIEDLLQETAVSGRRLSRESVMASKRERLRQESDGLLQVIDPTRTLDSIGGYEELKARLREIVSALRNAHDPLIRSTVPMGVLFLGPPGTGKSMTAEALAAESGISMAALGDFRGMYVGQSERNLSRILSLIESLHPVIVFVDELDQAFPKRGASSGDGGVDNRIFGRLLAYMSDPEHRGRILWVGASNFPDNIDPAMKRPGRFDLVLPFLLPEASSRGAILEKSLLVATADLERVEPALTPSDYERLAVRTDGFSGAELQAVVGEVLRRVAQTRSADSVTRIDAKIFDAVIDVYEPPADQRDNYRRMEKLAVDAVAFVDLLPPRYRDQRRRRSAPDA